MQTTWLVGLSAQPRPPLKIETTADVVIIGGGLTGTLSAYLLAKAGQKVVVLEKDGLAHGATAFTTAFITYVIDTLLAELVKMFGPERAKLIWQAGVQAISQIATIIETEQIDCDFKFCPEYLFSANSKEYENLKSEAEQAKALGFDPRLGQDGLLPFANHGYLLFKNQAKFEPLKFLAALRDRAEKLGARFYDKSEVLTIEPNLVKTGGGQVKAPYQIIATYDPFNHPRELFAHKGPYTSYVLEAELPKNILEEALYLDLQNPYHYFRLDAGAASDRLILGGEDHRDELKLDANRLYKSLENYLETLLPGVKHKITRRWNGPILETLDGLPYIGRFSKANPRQLVATGFSGNGMTYSLIAARLFTDLILGQPNPYEDLYDPRRIPSFRQLWEKGKDYVAELWHML